MSRTLIVGDVHGCLEELKTLVAMASLGKDDSLVLVGDLVAKGPDSPGVVRYARKHGALCVRGNHDAHLIRSKGDLDARYAHIAAELSDADWRYLEAQPYWRRLGQQVKWKKNRFDQVVVVHAGFDPRYEPEDQRPQDMISMRSLEADGTPSKRFDERPWAASWPGPELVVFGHDAAHGIQKHAFAIGLDSGCCYGGQLTGILLDGKRPQWLEVPAARVYSEIR